MPSTERAPSTSRDETLLAVAHASVASGLRNGRPLEIDPALYPTLLRAPGACFVTLRIDGVLRGCTGTLEALELSVSPRAVATMSALAATYQNQNLWRDAAQHHLRALTGWVPGTGIAEGVHQTLAFLMHGHRGGSRSDQPS